MMVFDEYIRNPPASASRRVGRQRRAGLKPPR